ncbi:MAG: response regulator [Thermoguttaceae bacterium]
MHDNPYRALVVDDESIARDMIVHALEREGFLCDIADNGLDAKSMAEATGYDAVITDLRMPGGHGYALARDLLTWQHRPLIAVVTSMDDPRLVKDLIACGVDDVEFKPLHYNLFAAKVSALAGRRRGIRINYIQPLIAWKLDR